MTLGDLNETVAILQPVTTGTSSTGEPVVSWVTVDHWDVHVEVLTGTERLGATDAPTNVNTYRITGRNRDDLQPTLRLRRGGAQLEILAAPPMPRSPWSIVDCREVDRG